MMRSASREALDTLRRQQAAAVGVQLSAPELAELADELYSVADLLVAQPLLRRALGDPATGPESRAQLARGLLAGQVSETAAAVVQAAVRERWSSPWDLTDAFELGAADALFASAELDGILDTVEDELFGFERVLDGADQLAVLLDDQSADPARRLGLLDSVVGDKVHPITKALLAHAVTSQRRRSVAAAVDDLLEQAAARRDRSVARVVAAAELTAEQQAQLTTALSDLYGRAISLRIAIDPTVLGGAIIRVGDEVIDASIAARLMNARNALTA